MLRAIFGPYRHTKNHRKAQLASRHRLPFCKLIENLVASAANEIGIHQFDERAASGKRVTDCRRDDGRLGDRRIEKTVIGDDIGKASMYTEGTAPVTAFLAIGDQAAVMCQVMKNRLRQRVTKRDRTHRRQLAAVLGNTESGFSRDRLYRRRLGRFGQQVIGLRTELDLFTVESHLADDGGVSVQIDCRGELPVDNDARHSLDLFTNSLGHPLRLGSGDDVAFNQPVAEPCDRVMRLPGLEFVTGTAGIRVCRRVAGVPVAFDIEKGRPVAASQNFGLARHRICHRKRVRAIDSLGMELFRPDTGTNS